MFNQNFRRSDPGDAPSLGRDGLTRGDWVERQGEWERRTGVVTGIGRRVTVQWTDGTETDEQPGDISKIER